MGVGVVGLTGSGRDSVALFEEIGDSVAVGEAGGEVGCIGGGGWSVWG